MLDRLAPSLRKATAALGLVALATCADIDNFDVPVGAKATIPKATLIDQVLGSLDFLGFNDIDLSKSFANQGVSKDQVDSVKLKSMTLEITSPSGASFDFLDSVVFFAEASGLEKVQVASLAEVPGTSSKLDLVVNTEVDLKPYVVAPSMTLKAEIQGKRPDQDTTVEANAVLDVDVHIPGCN